MFPASKFGNIKTFASPFIGLLGALDSAISGIIAASNCNSPSTNKLGSFSFTFLVALITFSVNSECALPCVEYESIATFGSFSTNCLKLLLEEIAISDNFSSSGFSFNPLSPNINVPLSPYSQSGTTITKNAETNLVPGAVFKIWSAGLNVFAVE